MEICFHKEACIERIRIFMEKLRNMLYAVTERVVPAAAFQKMWAYYV